MKFLYLCSLAVGTKAKNRASALAEQVGRLEAAATHVANVVICVSIVRVTLIYQEKSVQTNDNNKKCLAIFVR